MLSEYYDKLKPEDRAFCDGFMCAIKYLEEYGENQLDAKLQSLVLATVASYGND